MVDGRLVRGERKPQVKIQYLEGASPNRSVTAWPVRARAGWRTKVSGAGPGTERGVGLAGAGHRDAEPGVHEAPPQPAEPTDVSQSVKSTCGCAPLVTACRWRLCGVVRPSRRGRSGRSRAVLRPCGGPRGLRTRPVPRRRHRPRRDDQGGQQSSEVGGEPGRADHGEISGRRVRACSAAGSVTRSRGEQSVIWSSGAKVPRSRTVRHAPVASAPPALWPTASRAPSQPCSARCFTAHSRASYAWTGRSESGAAAPSSSRRRSRTRPAFLHDLRQHVFTAPGSTHRRSALLPRPPERTGAGCVSWRGRRSRSGAGRRRRRCRSPRFRRRTGNPVIPQASSTCPDRRTTDQGQGPRGCPSPPSQMRGFVRAGVSPQWGCRVR